MKKLFALFSIILICFAASAKEVVSIPDSTAVTFSKVYNDVKEGITGLATALKAPAEHVYTILVKQQVVNATTSLTVCIFMLLLGSILFYTGYKIYVNYNETYNKNNDYKPGYRRYDMDEGYWLIFIIVGTIIFIGGLIGLTVESKSIITGFFNPEYGAIKDIIGFIK